MQVKKYRKAVFIVTYHRPNKEEILYLMLYRKLHWKGWEFPKGGVGRLELKIRAVKRESFEETGQNPIKIKSFRIHGKYKYHALLPDRPGYMGQKYKLYSAELKNKRIKFDKKEHSSYKWQDYKNAIKLLKWPNQRKCLRIVNGYLIKNENPA